MFEQAAVEARATIEPVLSAPLFGLTDDQVRSGLVAGFRLIQAATAMTARLVREADSRGLPAGDGTASLKRWLTMTLLASSYEAGKLVKLGEVLDARPGVAAGVAAGRVTAEQARMIADALDDLPRDTGADVAAKAEEMLVGFAEQLPPAQLRAVGSRILAHVDPDAADRADHEATQRRNNHAHRKRTLAYHPTSTRGEDPAATPTTSEHRSGRSPSVTPPPSAASGSAAAGVAPSLRKTRPGGPRRACPPRSRRPRSNVPVPGRGGPGTR